VIDPVKSERRTTIIHSTNFSQYDSQYEFFTVRIFPLDTRNVICTTAVGHLWVLKLWVTLVLRMVPTAMRAIVRKTTRTMFFLFQSNRNTSCNVLRVRRSESRSNSKQTANGKKYVVRTVFERLVTRKLKILWNKTIRELRCANVHKTTFYDINTDRLLRFCRYTYERVFNDFICYA